MAEPVAAIPEAEADVHAWAQDYVQRMRTAGEKPSRAAITRALRDRFGVGSGRASVLTWFRILFWVAWILMML